MARLNNSKRAIMLLSGGNQQGLRASGGARAGAPSPVHRRTAAIVRAEKGGGEWLGGWRQALQRLVGICARWWAEAFSEGFAWLATGLGLPSHPLCPPSLQPARACAGVLLLAAWPGSPPPGCCRRERLHGRTRAPHSLVYGGRMDGFLAHTATTTPCKCSGGRTWADASPPARLPTLPPHTSPLHADKRQAWDVGRFISTVAFFNQGNLQKSIQGLVDGIARTVSGGAPVGVGGGWGGGSWGGRQWGA